MLHVVCEFNETAEPTRQAARLYKLAADQGNAGGRVALARVNGDQQPAPLPPPQEMRPGTRVAVGAGTTGGSPSGGDYRPAKYRPNLTPEQIAHPSNYREQFLSALSAYDDDLVRIAFARFNSDVRSLDWLQRAQQQRDANNINRTKPLIYPVG